jgi:NTE family protein
MEKKKTPKTVGLALGSGGFRGPAHIGVIKTLVKHGIPIDYISGSSIGSLVGAHYALYQDVEKLENDMFSKQREKVTCLFDVNWSNGILSGRRIQKFLEDMLNNSRFEDLRIPLGVTATDLVSGQAYEFYKGSVPLAVRASISIPVTFTPIKIDDMQLVDGGLTNPIPDDMVKKMGADVVIAVNLYNDYNYDTTRLTLAKVVMRSIEIILSKLARNTVPMADVVIEPDTSSFANLPRYKRYLTPAIMRNMMKAGEESAEAAIPEIKKLLGLIG